MTRQIYQNIGLIIAIVIASASLPVGIVGFMREAVVNNYYDQTYYVNNQTQTEQYYPPENNTYNNLTGNPEWFHHRVYNLTGNYVINWWINRTNSNQLGVWIIQDYLFDLWLEDVNHYFYHMDNFGSALYFKKEWNVPFSDTWHVYFYYLHSGVFDLNITIITTINKI